MFRFLARVHLEQWEEESANFWVSVIPSDGVVRCELGCCRLQTDLCVY